MALLNYETNESPVDCSVIIKDRNFKIDRDSEIGVVAIVTSFKNNI